MAVLSRPRVSSWLVLFQTLVPLFSYLARAHAANAQSSPSQELEYRVKAAYLLNFSRYVEWPAAAFRNPEAPILICVLGEDPFGPTLARTVARQRTQGREVQSLHLQTVDGVLPAGCQVLYVGADHRRSHDWQSLLRDHPVVTVGEGEEFLAEGGMIGYVLLEETVRFAVSLPAVHGSGLRISSRVLSLATRVIQDRS